MLVNPIDIGTDLEEVDGDRHGKDAVIRGNRVTDIRDGSVASVPLPGIGIAVQPLEGVRAGRVRPRLTSPETRSSRRRSCPAENCEHARVWKNADRVTGRGN